MKINIDQLRDLKSQGYEPTVTQVDETYFETFQGKDFETEANLLELFHENTKYTDAMGFRLKPSATQFTTGTGFAYAQAKLQPDYPGHELLELPDPDDLDESFTDVIEQRRSQRDMAGEELTLQELSTLLYHSCGVTGHKHLAVGTPTDDTGGETDGDTGDASEAGDANGGADAGDEADGTATGDEDGEEMEPVTQSFRAYASAGGLYPVETYLLVQHGGPNLPEGTYYYVPEEHGLRVLELDPDLTEKRDELFTLTTDIIDVAEASVVFVLTASFWRAMAKYGPRCYRYIMQESGHLAQNALLSAAAMDLAAVPLAGFRDSALDSHLDIDGVNEGAIYTVAVSKQDNE
jgi:SagB-type dehydrogenase family enzyme